MMLYGQLGSLLEIYKFVDIDLQFKIYLMESLWKNQWECLNYPYSQEDFF